MKKAEASACLEHTVPSHLIEELHSTYQSGKYFKIPLLVCNAQTPFSQPCNAQAPFSTIAMGG